ncbi:heme exporter protein CcmD [Psychromonas sp. 14N.309.X.WAT.B.A12]|uniref:heme exporter protein CcmD n=1 Tax=unclassified Psychromonas TaxID=2614957 RepID=UPI0025AFB188|nr:heme exporter protein CcmD [Psychromonas sp. 14N.309.X.WAT.B.A12]MDN2662865.1 heme exporter protein CcmD [Psychromonas sp. 14N.309.X.WAT.B.A12]
MAFTSFSDFIAMGGYSFYVWLAYGVSIVSVIALITHSVLTRKKILKQVEQRLQREKRIKAANNREHSL